MSNTPVSYSKKVKSWRDSRTKRQKEGRLSRGIDSRQPTPEHQRKRRYPLTRKRYRQPYFPFIPINSRFSLKIKPSVNLHPSPKPPPLTLLNFSTGGEAARQKFIIATGNRKMMSWGVIVPSSQYEKAGFFQFSRWRSPRRLRIISLNFK